jgi:hypothetical protein
LATLMSRSGRPPSSSIAARSSAIGLPWAPFWFATAATPWPFSVRARMAVGRPSVWLASPRAASMAATSCPSISMVCHPNAATRLA